MKKTKYFIEEEKRTNIMLGIVPLLIGFFYLIVGMISINQIINYNFDFDDVFIAITFSGNFLFVIFLLFIGFNLIEETEIIKKEVKKEECEKK